MVLKMNEGWRKIIKFAHGANYKIVVARSSESTSFNKIALHFHHRRKFLKVVSFLAFPVQKLAFIG